jgi:hypothetical protein
VPVFEDAGSWWVEIREGGADGDSRWFELPDRNKALECARDMIALSGFGEWREMPHGWGKAATHAGDALGN